jgi:hypothetical protein
MATPLAPSRISLKTHEFVAGFMLQKTGQSPLPNLEDGINTYISIS